MLVVVVEPSESTDTIVLSISHGAVGSDYRCVDGRARCGDLGAGHASFISGNSQSPPLKALQVRPSLIPRLLFAVCTCLASTTSTRSQTLLPTKARVPILIGLSCSVSCASNLMCNLDVYYSESWPCGCSDSLATCTGANRTVVAVPEPSGLNITVLPKGVWTNVRNISPFLYQSLII